MFAQVTVKFSECTCCNSSRRGTRFCIARDCEKSRSRDTVITGHNSSPVVLCPRKPNALLSPNARDMSPSSIAPRSRPVRGAHVIGLVPFAVQAPLERDGAALRALSRRGSHVCYGHGVSCLLFVVSPSCLSRPRGTICHTLHTRTPQ